MLLAGGTFDPPHDGHVLLADAARTWIGEDSWLVFVPAACSPHKPDRLTAPDADRAAMLRLAVRPLPRCGVWEEELRRGGPSYWVDTLEVARHQLGSHTELRFLIGADQLLALPRWRAWRRLLELAEPVVLLRPPHATVEGLLQALTAEPGWQGEPLHPWRSRCAEAPLSEASSTSIRAALARGDTAIPHLDPMVLGYIQERGLYRG